MSKINKIILEYLRPRSYRGPHQTRHDSPNGNYRNPLHRYIVCRQHRQTYLLDKCLKLDLGQ